MSKNEFLDQLFQLLSDLSPEERDEAISYYREYIEDAGFGNEETIIEKLGTPQEVAAEIKSGMANKSDTDINYSSNTVKDSPEPYFGKQSNCQDEDTYSYNHKNPNIAAPKIKLNRATITLIIIALIFLSPVWGGLLIPILSVIFGIIVGLFGIIIGCAAAGFGCFIAGIVIIIWGIVSIFSSPLVGIALFGAGLVVTAIGILLMLLTGCICTDVIPCAIRGIRNLIHRINKRKEAHV